MMVRWGDRKCSLVLGVDLSHQLACDPGFWPPWCFPVVSYPLCGDRKAVRPLPSPRQTWLWWRRVHGGDSSRPSSPPWLLLTIRIELHGAPRSKAHGAGCSLGQEARGFWLKLVHTQPPATHHAATDALTSSCSGSIHVPWAAVLWTHPSVSPVSGAAVCPLTSMLSWI